MPAQRCDSFLRRWSKSLYLLRVLKGPWASLPEMRKLKKENVDDYSRTGSVTLMLMGEVKLTLEGIYSTTTTSAYMSPYMQQQECFDINKRSLGNILMGTDCIFCNRDRLSAPLF